MLALATPGFGANVLRDLAFSSSQSGGVRIVVSGDQVFEKLPPNFSITDPHRVVIDLEDTSSALTQKHYAIGAGGVESVTAVEAGGRTRLVANLSESSDYNVYTDGKSVVLTVGDVQPGTALVAAAPVTATSPPAAATSPGKSPAAAPGARENVYAPPPTTLPPALTNVDFRRTPKGGGKVILSFSTADISVKEDERLGRVLLALPGVQVAEDLQKTFDVADFATPVRSIKVEPVGVSGARVTISAGGAYEYEATQIGNLYTVAFEVKKPKQRERATLKPKDYAGKRVSLNFQDIEVRSVLQLLADFTGLNMVVSDTVGGNITLRLKDVPWDQALDIILQTKGLAMRQRGNVIMVAPIEEVAARERLELEAQQQTKELAPLVSELMQVNYAKAENLAEILKAPENRILTARGSVTVDGRTNTLLVQDTAATLEEVRVLVADLDRPVRQLLVESRVVIASDDFARELGVRFGFNTSGTGPNDNSWLLAGGKPGHISGTAGFAPGIENPPDSGNESLMVNLPTVLGGDRGGALNLLIGKAGEQLLQLELSAMQQEGKGEVLSSPRVITSDQQKAVIKQGVEIPYQEATSSGATNVQFKEAVLKLEVTPHITPDDRVIMDLIVTKDNPDFSRTVLGVPPVDTRSVETSVLVDNGETVVLGGVFEEETVVDEEKIPFLGDIPGVGYLFRNKTNAHQKRELLIFVTPKILKESLQFTR
ncbi:MAG: type IV pilus secretin PilQ [Pseudomonadota bacterium]